MNRPELPPRADRRRAGSLARLAFALPLALVLAACGGEEKEKPSVVSVAVAPAVRAEIDETLALEGRLVPPPERDATLAPQVAGRLESVSVREGDAVKAGALLAAVDARAAEEALRTAHAAVAKAEQEAKSKESVAATSDALFTKGIAAREERDADRAAAEAARSAKVEAQSQLEKAEREHGYTRLLAPFDGVVAQVMKHAGETVDGTAAAAVVRLLGTGTPEVAVTATAADLARLAPGQPADVRDGRDGGVSIPARVARVARAVDPATGLGEARLALLGKTSLPLLSAVKAAVVLARHAALLTVPASALRRAEDGSEEVVAVKDGVCHPRRVTIGLRDGRVEVKVGLAEGESVVTDSPLGLVEGQHVTVAGSAAPKG